MTSIDIHSALDTLRNNIEYAREHHAVPLASDHTKEVHSTTRKRDISHAMKSISDYVVARASVSSPGSEVTSSDLQLSLHTILQACGDASPDIRHSGTDNLNKIIKSVVHTHAERVLVVLFKGMKMPNRLSQREALQQFANMARHMKPQKCRTFSNYVIPLLKNMFAEPDQAIMAIMGDCMGKILRILGFYITREETRTWIQVIYAVLGHESPEVRRNAAQSIAHMCHYIPKCSIDKVLLDIHDIAHEALQVSVMSDGSEVVKSTNNNPVQGCMQTYTSMLDVLQIIRDMSSKAAADLVSLNQLFTNLICDLLVVCLSITDQAIISPSLELLSRLLSQFSHQCSNWRKEKVNTLLHKLFAMVESDKLVTVKSSAIEVLSKFCEVFTELVMDYMIDNAVAFEGICNLLEDEDYLIRGKTAIWIATIVQQCIINSVDISTIPFRKNRYPVHVNLATREDETTIAVYITEYDSQQQQQQQQQENATDSDQQRIEKANKPTFSETSGMISHLVHLLLRRAQIEESSLCLRMVCTACSMFLPACMNVIELCPLVPTQLLALIGIDDSFWGVKIELLGLLQHLDYTLLEYYEESRGLGSQSISEVLVNNVIWKYVEDEDARVRSKACATLVALLPELNLRGSDFSTENVKRSAWDTHFHLLLQRQLASKDIHCHTRQTYIRDQEIMNVSVLLHQCLTKISLVDERKSNLLGLLELLNALARNYGPFDESQTSLINPNKGLGCIEGAQVLRNHAIEAIQKMLDLILFHDVSTDLLLHAKLVENIGLFTMQFEFLSEHSSHLLQAATDILLRYLFTMLDLVKALITHNRSGASESFDTDRYLSRTSDDSSAQDQSQSSQHSNRDGDSATPILFSKPVFEKLCSNMMRSTASSTVVAGKEDALTGLVGNVIRTLYFVILFGDQTSVTTHTVKIMSLLRYYMSDHKQNTILCMQEMFVLLFGRKNTYYVDQITFDTPPIKVEDASSELFGKMFIEGRRVNTLEQYVLHSAERQSFLKTNHEKNPLFLGNRVGVHRMGELLSLFEPMVIRLKRTFRHTHSHKIHNLILFMLSRMVFTGVDFQRLDKDHSFLKYVLKLLDEMHLYTPDGTEVQNTALYQIMDFVSILLFTVKFRSKALDQNALLSTISNNISASNWSATYIIQSLGPLLVRSVTENASKSDEASHAASTYGECLLEIVLKYIHFTECARIVTTLMKTTYGKNIELWKSLSQLVCDKVVNGISFEFFVSWSHLDREIDDIFAFFDSLHVMGNDEEVKESVPMESLCHIELDLSKRQSSTETDDEELSHPSPPKDKILRALLLMRWMNQRNAHSEPIEIQLQKLGLYLDICLSVLSVSHHSACKGITLEQLSILVRRMLIETVHIATTIIKRNDDTAVTKGLAQYHETFRGFLKYIDSISDHEGEDGKRSTDRFDSFTFTTMLSLLTNYALSFEPFVKELMNFCTHRLTKRKDIIPHFRATQNYAHYFAIALLLSEAREVTTLLEGLDDPLNEVFWEHAVHTHRYESVTSAMLKRLRAEEKIPSENRHFDVISNMIRRSLDGENGLCSISKLKSVLGFVEQLPQISGLREDIMSARTKCTLGVQRHVFDSHIGRMGWKKTIESLQDSMKDEKYPIPGKVEDLKKIDDCAVIAALLKHQNGRISQVYKFAPRMLAQLSPNMLEEILHDNFDAFDIPILASLTKTIHFEERYMAVIIGYLLKNMQRLMQTEVTNFSNQMLSLSKTMGDILIAFSNSPKLTSLRGAAYPKWVVDSTTTMIDFYCKVHDYLVLDHMYNGSIIPHEIAVLMRFTAGALILLEVAHSTFPEDYKNRFLGRACTLILNATSTGPSEQNYIAPPYSTASDTNDEDKESLMALVNSVISRIYPPVSPMRTTEGPFKLHSLLGNQIPYIFEEQLPMIFGMHLSVARLFLYESYKHCMVEEYRYQFDKPHITQLMRQIEEIGCDEHVFLRIWDIAFDLFQTICMDDEETELQVDSLKLLTKLLCVMRLKNPTEKPQHQQQQPQTSSKKRSETPREPHSRRTSSIRRVSPTLKNFIQTLDEYLLTGTAGMNLHAYPQEGDPVLKRYARVDVDEVFGRAIFNGFFKFMEDAIHRYKQKNPTFMNELVKSLNLVIFKNPRLFVPMTTSPPLLEPNNNVDVKSSPGGLNTSNAVSPALSTISSPNDALFSGGVNEASLRKSFPRVPNPYLVQSSQPQQEQQQKLDFAYVFSIFRNINVNNVSEDDWLLRQHLGTGMCKSFSSLPNNAREQHSLFMLKFLQDALKDEHLRMQAYSGILSLIQSGQHNIVSRLIPFLSETVQSMILEERVLHSQILSIHMITSIIQYFPDASVHDLTRKYLEAMFSLSNFGTTPLQVVDHIYSSFRHLLANYALSDFERKLLEALTSVKQNGPSKVQNYHGNDILSPKSPLGTPNKRSSIDISRTLSPPMNASPQHSRRMTLSSLFGGNRAQMDKTPGLGGAKMSPSRSKASALSASSSLFETQKSQLRQRLNQKKHEENLIVYNPHARRVLLLSLMATSMYSSLDLIENSAVMKEDATGGASNFRERCKMNVLQLFQDMEYRSKTRREVEVLLRFLPQLLEDFFDPEQILPLIFGDFLGVRPNPLMLSLVLCVRIPAMFGTTTLDTYGVSGTLIGGNEKDETRRQTLQSFTDWIKLSLNSLVLKRPVIYAEWSILCLFISTCSCRNFQHEALFAEYGCSLPPVKSPAAEHRPLEETFTRYGVLFHNFFDVDKNVFLASEDGESVQKELVKVLQGMREESTLANNLLTALDKLTS